MDYAIGTGAQISSNSWGANSAGFSEYLNTSLEAVQDTHLFVAAAGNDGRLIGAPNLPWFTCNVNAANQICVASSNPQGTKSHFSNWSKELVHVFAPGTDIYSTYPVALRSYSYLSGRVRFHVTI